MTTFFFGSCWYDQSVSRYDELACESVGFVGSLFLIFQC
ncbi:unnamed protein product, partial [Ectocarpus sp. 13 AM-2016]